jgi:hypothetical protein
MISSNCFSCVPSCPPVCEDSNKISSQEDQKLPLPSNDEEMIKVLSNFKFDECDFCYPFLTPKLLAATGKYEWDQGRWLQPGQSVYGVAVYFLLHEDTSELYDLFFLSLTLSLSCARTLSAPGSAGW